MESFLYQNCFKPAWRTRDKMTQPAFPAGRWRFHSIPYTGAVPLAGTALPGKHRLIPPSKHAALPRAPHEGHGTPVRRKHASGSRGRWAMQTSEPAPCRAPAAARPSRAPLAGFSPSSALSLPHLCSLQATLRSGTKASGTFCNSV